MKLHFDSLISFNITKDGIKRVFIYAQATAGVLTLQSVHLNGQAGFEEMKLMTMHNRHDAHEHPKTDDFLIEMPYSYGLAILNTDTHILEFIDRPYAAVFASLTTGRQRSVLMEERDFLKGYLMLEFGDCTLV